MKNGVNQESFKLHRFPEKSLVDYLWKLVFMPITTKRGGHTELPLSACPYVQFVSRVTQKTVFSTDMKPYGYDIQGVNLYTWVFSSVRNYYSRRFGPLFCENMTLLWKSGSLGHLCHMDTFSRLSWLSNFCHQDNSPYRKVPTDRKKWPWSLETKVKYFY